MSVAALILRSILFAVFYFVPDIFLVQAIRKAFSKNPRKALRIFWIANICVFAIAVASFALMRYLPENISRSALYFFGIFVGFLFSKLIVAGFLFGELLLLRILASFFRRIINRPAREEKKFLLSRRKFIAQTSLLIGAIPFSGFIYGMIKGRYQFTVRRETVFFDDLPPAFDGFSITQFSDLHIGSWEHAARHKLEYAAELIQSLNSDILFFTGDVVNSRATEMDDWFDVFKNFSAPFGKFSILGNHDYGDYVNWKTEEAKAANLQAVKNIHPQLGFDLLLNENRILEKDGEKIYLLGVENWGSGDFPKFGDLEKANENVPADAFKILLSHDPSHWDAKVLQQKFPPQLTLSGHTHGFQMGIETPVFRFSPSQWVYKQWAGLYTKENKYIYVNRGLGTVGYPGRIGVWPEITQLILKRKN